MNYELVTISRNFNSTMHAYDDYLDSDKFTATIHRLTFAENYISNHANNFNDADFKEVYSRADNFFKLYNEATRQLDNVERCINLSNITMAMICLFNAKSTIAEVYSMSKPSIPIQPPVADSSTLEKLNRRFQSMLRNEKKARK